MVCILPEAEILLIDNILPVLNILHYYYNLFDCCILLDCYSLDHILFVLPDPCQNRSCSNFAPQYWQKFTPLSFSPPQLLHLIEIPSSFVFYKNIIFFIEILSQSLILCNNVPKINHIIQQCHTDCKPEKNKYIFYSMLFYISHPQ